MVNVSRVSGCTEVKAQDVLYKWTIKRFSLCREKTGEFIKSPTFSVGGSSSEPDKTEWQLSLYPRGKQSGSHVTICLFLIGPKATQWATYELGLINDKQEEVFPRKQIDPTEFSSTDQTWIHRQSHLSDPAKGLLPNDTLTIYCKLSVIADGDYLSTSTNLTSGTDAISNTAVEVAHDLSHLFQSMQLSDVTFSVAGESFQAHKVILAARSPVFAAMFGSEMREQASNLVEIPDVDPKVFHEMLKFMYSGEVKDVKETEEELLATADKYALHSLKKVCEKSLMAGLSFENAAHLLYLGDLHSATQLEARAVDFIASQAKEVMQTEGWKSLETQHPRLTVKVLRKLVS